MANGNFAPCNLETRKWEGGDVNHPKDPGGLTSRGVTQARGAAYRRAQGLAPKLVTAWSDAEVTRFYTDEFWGPMGCEALPFGVDLATYDAGVNSGPARGLKWAAAARVDDVTAWIKGLCARRLGFVQGLKTWATFGRGWSRRIVGIEATAVAMFLASKFDPGVVSDALADESVTAANKSIKQAGTAAGGTVSGTGAIVLDSAGNSSINWWVVVIGGLALAAFVAFLMRHARLNRERADAYASAAVQAAAAGV